MGFSLRIIAEDIRFEQAVTLNALERAVPQDEVEAVIEDLGVQEKRMRKLPAFMTLLLCIGMGLYTNIGLESVLNKMVGSYWELGKAVNSSYVKKSGMTA